MDITGYDGRSSSGEGDPELYTTERPGYSATTSEKSPLLLFERNRHVLDLSIEGKKIIIPKVRKRSVDYSHGALEELITVNVHPSTAAEKVAEECSSDNLSPHSSKREEVISLLLDAVWPEVVEVLRPLVLRVVQVSHEIDLKYGDNLKNPDHDENDKMSVDDGYASW